VKYHGESAWAKATRVRVRHTDGSEENYFMKARPICDVYKMLPRYE